MRRQDSELVKQIYLAMKESPLKYDWILLVNKDRQDMDLNFTDEDISKLSKSEFKRIVKLMMKKLTLGKIKVLQVGHSKVKHIKHCNLKGPQPYFTSLVFI